MTRVPRERLRELRDAVQILAVIEHLEIPTRRRGSRWTFRCPGCGQFHSNVSSARNLAYCFRCRRRFNAIDLVIAETRWGFPKAVEYLESLLR